MLLYKMKLNDAPLADVAGLIVVFNPDYAALNELIDRLRYQVAKIYIVNNGTVDTHYRKFRSGVQTAGVTFIEMGINVGVATALNKGIGAAFNAGFIACWTFDQDSLPGANDALLLYSSLRRVQHSSLKVAAIAPVVVNLNRAKPLPFLVSGGCNTVREVHIEYEQEVSAAITSGMLVSTHAWRETGGMRDNYFIDLVDTEWCFRARAQGFCIFCNPAARLQHRLGEKMHKRQCFPFRISRQRPPYRIFYMVRNTLRLGSESYAPSNWYAYSSPKLLRTCLLALLMGPNRIEQAKAILHGLICAWKVRRIV